MPKFWSVSRDWWSFEYFLAAPAPHSKLILKRSSFSGPMPISRRFVVSISEFHTTRKSVEIIQETLKYRKFWLFHEMSPPFVRSMAKLWMKWERGTATALYVQGKRFSWLHPPPSCSLSLYSWTVKVSSAKNLSIFAQLSFTMPAPNRLSFLLLRCSAAAFRAGGNW